MSLGICSTRRSARHSIAHYLLQLRIRCGAAADSIWRSIIATACALAFRQMHFARALKSQGLINTET